MLSSREHNKLKRAFLALYEGEPCPMNTNAGMRTAERSALSYLCNTINIADTATFDES